MVRTTSSAALAAAPAKPLEQRVDRLKRAVVASIVLLSERPRPGGPALSTAQELETFIECALETRALLEASAAE